MTMMTRSAAAAAAAAAAMPLVSFELTLGTPCMPTTELATCCWIESSGSGWELKQGVPP